MLDPTLGSDFHAPTDANKTRPDIHDVDVQFDRPPFVGTMHVPKISKFWQKMKGKDGKYIYNNKPVGDKGRPKEQFLTAHNLSANSTPLDFLNAFCPVSLTDTWTTYTNNKVILANAGQPGRPYPDWTPFQADELRKYIAVRILRGVSPLP